MKKLFQFLLPVLIFSLLIFAPVSKTHAATFLNGNTVTTSEQKTIEGSLFAGGQTVIINGQINGDVFCAGQTITINANINGDVICAGQTIQINGVVDGNIRLAGQTITVIGTTNKNATLLGQSIIINNATVLGELQSGASSIMISNTRIDKGIISASDQLTLDGSKISGDIQSAVQTLVIDQGSAVTGNLSYVSTKEVVINDATVSGTIVRSEPPKETKVNVTTFPNKLTPKRIGYSGIPSLLVWLGMAILLAILTPNLFTNSYNKLSKYPLRSFVYGFFALFAAPFVFLMICITLIGIPFAILGVFFLILIIVILRIVVSAYVGKRILDNLSRVNSSNIIFSTVLGILVIWLLTKIPFIGFLISLIVTMYAAGLLVLLIINRKK